MLNLDEFQAGFAPPRRVTEYTGGTGTFTPLPGSLWRRETLVSGAGGGGGGSVNAGNGGGRGGRRGNVYSRWVQSDGLTKSYAIGAGGAGGAAGGYGVDGGSTSLGATTVPGGQGGAPNPATGHTPMADPGDSGPVSTYGRGGYGGAAVSPGLAGTGGIIIIEEY